MNKVEKYIKDNNIQGYLSSALDTDKIAKYIKNDKKEMKLFEEERDFNEDINTLEDYIYYLIENYNFELTMQNEDIEEMLDYIYGCEFDLEINKNGTLNLIDLQNAYLGGNYSNFETIDSALGRLSGSYLYDYFGIEVL
jgi:hypothetical protein